MRSLAIPRAHVLADVASKKMMANPFPFLFGDIPAQFNGRVGNAFSAVENIRLDDRAGRARIDASRTTAAAVGNRRVVRQFQIGQDAAKEQPRSHLLINDARVLSEPADTRVFRVNTLDERARIDVGFRSVRGVLLDPIGKLT